MESWTNDPPDKKTSNNQPNTRQNLYFFFSQDISRMIILSIPTGYSLQHFLLFLLILHLVVIMTTAAAASWAAGRHHTIRQKKIRPCTGRIVVNVSGSGSGHRALPAWPLAALDPRPRGSPPARGDDRWCAPPPWCRSRDEPPLLPPRASRARLFIDSICSTVSTTSFIDGRLRGSPARQLSVSCAAWKACLELYWPSNRGSMSRASFRRSARYGFAQSARLSCPLGRLGSSARCPDSISSITTPKP